MSGTIPILNLSEQLKAAQAQQSAGYIMAIGAAITSAIGSYYQAEATKYQAKSQMSALAFQQEIASRNAAAAHRAADEVIAAGRQEIGRYTMAAGQKAATSRARMAARGIQAGVGSASETEASDDLIKQIDVLTLNSNTVRRAAATRMQASNYRTQATMLGVSAENARATAKSIQPWMAPTASLLGSAGMLGIQWSSDKIADLRAQGVT